MIIRTQSVGISHDYQQRSTQQRSDTLKTPVQSLEVWDVRTSLNALFMYVQIDTYI